MADEIARLGVAVDSTSAVSAVKDIDALAAAGDRASSSAKKLGSAWDGVSVSPAKIYTVNQSLAAFRKEAAAAAAAASKVDDSWKKNLFGDSALMRANQSLVRFRETQAKVVAESGKVVTANKLVAESHHQVSKAAVGYTKSAKEMAFATRNLPAQFTDIAVSLQAGQNPLTVLLQQGGQLKDMFGGIGPAAKALGGYVLGLVNPYSVAALAVAALGIAWIKGDAEARKFHATLEIQGDSLGVTTDGLVRASEELARFGQSQGAASKALNQTAASGKIFGDSIQLVAQAALNMERETGQAVEKTVEQFASLSGEPVDAAMKLDETYKFLTASTYAQIRSLEEQGDVMGASQLAMNELAETINTRTANIEENLGTLEKSWRLVANSAKWAWDQMLNIGRADSVSDQIIGLNDHIREINNPTNFMSHAQLGPAGSEARKARVKQLQDDIRELQVVYRAEQAKAAQQQTEEQGRIASVSLANEARLGQTNSEKRITAEARIQAQTTLAINGIVAKNADERAKAEAVIRANAAKSLEAANKRYADPKGPKEKKSQEAKDAERFLKDQARDYEALDKQLDSHAATLSAAGEAQDKLSSFERYAIKTLSDLDNGHTSLNIAQRAEMKTRIEGLRVIDQENQARDKQNKIMAVSADLNRRIADELTAQGQGHHREMLGIGRGQEAGALEMSLEDIRIRSMQERIKLEEKYQNLHAVGSDQYIADLRTINEAEAQLSNNEIAQMERRRAAAGDWRNGARAAMEDIGQQMGDTAGMTRDAFMGAFGAMNNALTNFAQTGKLKIRDFATTVIAELLRIALTIAVSKALTAMFGDQASLSTGAAANGTISYGNGSGYRTAANGAVLSNGMISAAANGTLFGGKGGVRDSATIATMSNGDRLLMAEERPEAVMPLARGPNGKLGVMSSGGGGSSVVNVSTVVNIAQDGSATSSTSSDGDNAREGKQLAELMEAKVRQIIQEERRQGGLLWAMVNGR